MKYRHSSSFFLSIIIHLILVAAVLYGYQNITQPPKEQEKRVKINLCDVQIKKEAPAVVAIANEKKIIPAVKKEIKKDPIKPKEQPKKIKPKPKKKPKPKPTPKPKPKKPIEPKPKPTPKKTIEPKPVEIKKEIEEPKKVVEQEPIKSSVSVEETPLENVEENVEEPRETLAQKNARLEKNYIDENIQEIVQLLRDNLYYPRSARKRGITGKVIVKFQLSSSAKVESIEIVSSQKEVLSRAAIKTIERLSGEFPKPSEELVLHVPINYTLTK